MGPNEWGGGFAISTVFVFHVARAEEGDLACIYVSRTVPENSMLVKVLT